MKPLRAHAASSPAKNRSQRVCSVLGLQAHALKFHRARPGALAVATELARRLHCEQVSIGLRRRGRLRIIAVSDAANVDARQDGVNAVLGAMSEAMDQRSAIIHPIPHARRYMPALAHEELVRTGGRSSVCSVPIVISGHSVGALTLERDQAFSPDCIELIKDAALFVGPILHMKQRMDQPILWRILEAVKPRNHGYGAWYEHTKPVLLGMAALLVAVVSLWPTTFQVVAPARIESIGQFVLAAPLDGFVKHASVRPGDSVSTGQVLLTLDDRDLLSEKQKWQSQVQRLDKEYRDALSTQNAAETVIARSKRDEAIVQLQLAERQLSRITLQAPIDGLLISGDFIESAGVPVKRGQELLTIAPEHSFRAIIEIAEEDVELVSNGQKASLVLQSGTTQAIALAIDRVSPAAQLLRDQNIFEADANPVGHLTALRHGMRGLARIDIDKRLMGSIIWRQFSRQVRRLSWKFFG